MTTSVISPATVLINALFYHTGLAGLRVFTERFVRAFCDACDGEERLVVVLPRSGANFGAALQRDTSARVMLLDVDGADKARMFWKENSVLPSLAKTIEAQVAISLDYHGPLLLRGIKSVVVVHDVNYKRFPENFGPLQRRFRDAVHRAVLRRASSVWTISSFSAQEIRHFFPRTTRIDIIGSATPHEWYATGAAAKPPNVSSPYLLSVGTFYHHKNAVALIDSFLEADMPYRLVLIGGKGPALRDNRLRELLRRGGNRLILKHDVTDDEMRGYYAHAHAYVTASLYEGFGLTVLEAMSAGTPVACSNRTAIPEVAGDCARFFDPDDSGDIRRALIDIAFDEQLRRRLSVNGRARAQSFSWASVAERAKKVCRELIEMPNSP